MTLRANIRLLAYSLGAYSLLAARCSLFGARCSGLVVRCSLFGARCSVLAFRCSLFGARCSVLAVPVRSSFSGYRVSGLGFFVSGFRYRGTRGLYLLSSFALVG